MYFLCVFLSSPIHSLVLVGVAMAGKQMSDIAHLLVYKKKDRGSVTHIADRLGNPGPVVGEWLILTPKTQMPKPDVVSFPKPPKAPDGSLMYDRIPNKPEAEKIPLNAVAPSGVGGAIAAVGGGGGGGATGIGSGPIVSSGGGQPTSSPSPSLKRRPYEEINGSDSKYFFFFFFSFIERIFDPQMDCYKNNFFPPICWLLFRYGLG